MITTASEYDPVPKLSIMYGYTCDFTKHVRLISEQEIGKQPTEEFCEMLAEVTGDPWVMIPKKAYTLYGSRITYMGKNKPEYPTANRFDYVVILELGVAYGKQLVYMQFNIPEHSEV